MTWRIGIDLGGTKIEVAALDPSGALRLRRRLPTPPDYAGAVARIGAMVAEAEAEIGTPGRATIGIGIPGSVSPATGLIRGANSTFLNGQPLQADLEARLGRPVRLSNDANCLAMSEFHDRPGSGFAVILGTGVGGGVVVEGRLVEGRNRIAGEWGHTPLPWMTAAEHPGPACWCGQRGCIETFLCGPALAAEADGPGARDAAGLSARAEAGDAAARAALDRHADRLARALAGVINLLDPAVIVLGGGLSNMAHLYEALPRLIPRHVFSDHFDTPIQAARHGDSSGVLGAARLWP
ncbi:ROK family protein [Falsiroseomonas selenitidurans]|uniref:ROK family protein n=1 Tax=Falsiroseomonas selenitidurans TaxID=2716335 RepID=A0ABX1DYA5_9PROT|nr:ROK family protein [Falsiroseomonas selenitidurans]NKC29897.1 ROK family protein [Falsiroseomonas selenitidurans]